MHTSRRAALAAVAVTPFVVALMPAPSAQASAPTTAAPHMAPAPVRNGTCAAGEFCYYYRQGQGGSVSDHGDTLGNYGSSANPSRCYRFRGAGAGKGQCIRNNAASAWNRTGTTIRVYYSPNFKGVYQDIPAGAKVNLVPKLRNNNASHKPK